MFRRRIDHERIKQLYKDGFTRRQIAHIMKCSKGQVNYVLRGGSTYLRQRNLLRRIRDEIERDPTFARTLLEAMKHG